MSKDKLPIIVTAIIGFMIVMFGSILIIMASMLTNNTLLYIGLVVVGVAFVLYIVLITIVIVFYFKNKKKKE